MADQDISTDINLLRRTNVSVFVDEVLPDIIVVTFNFGLKIFKGVLLDSTKKNIPCGVPNINPAFTAKPDDDTLYSVNQRYAYTDPTNAKKKNVHISTKYKTNKMTVRLRPRQVLCTKCKGICNENSENVTRKRRTTEIINNPPIKRSKNAPITRSVQNSLGLNKTKKLESRRTLIPKAPQELANNALSGNVNKLNIQHNKININNNKKLQSVRPSFEHSDSSSNSDEAPANVRVLRKKSSSDDSSSNDTNILQEGSNNNLNDCNLVPNTRTLKICYGPQGEASVLKIPAQVDDSLEENIICDNTNKAARKALKKARKEAKRKVISATTSIDGFSVGGSSPRYTVGSASPRHGMGNNSPRYLNTAIAQQESSNTPKKRKHKMKHKKKHREDKDRKHKESDINLLSMDDESKESCVTQKLSINLKRLSTSSYTTIDNSIDKIEESSSDETNEQIPDFPHSPIIIRLDTPPLTSAIGADGGQLVIGDVVWGKIVGCPWWPGKVLTITHIADSIVPQANVSWYGSTKSSLIQCDTLSPYLDSFKIRYNKKKRGPYKEAIKIATSEARDNAELKIKENLAIVSPLPPQATAPIRVAITVVPPPMISPREINVSS